MSKIKEVRVEIVVENEEGGEDLTDLSSPTMDMAIEKMGAFERSMKSSGDFLKSSELETDELITIQK